jgi:hypothetical protein
MRSGTCPWFKQARSMDKVRFFVIRMVDIHVMLDSVCDATTSSRMKP